MRTRNGSSPEAFQIDLGRKRLEEKSKLVKALQRRDSKRRWAGNLFEF